MANYISFWLPPVDHSPKITIGNIFTGLKIDVKTFLLCSVLFFNIFSCNASQIDCPKYCSCTYSSSFGYIESKVECTHELQAEVPRFAGSFNVSLLDLSNNQITQLRKFDFSQYDALKSLYLTDNNIENLDREAFYNLQKLMNIDLAYNALHYIHPDIFSKNPVLETVSLRGNPLVYLPVNAPFIISESISSIDMSSCQLVSITSKAFSKLPNLSALDIGSNYLRQLDLGSLDFLKELTLLDVRNNMWTCDCQVAEVLTWLTRKRRDLGLTRELPPIKCFDHGEYRTLWTAAKAEEECTILQVKITATDLSISSTSRKQLQTTSQLDNTIVDESRVTESGIQIDDILEEKESETTAKEIGQYELGNKLKRKRTTKDPEQGTPIAEILHPRRESATERYRNSLWNEITRNSNMNLVFVVFPVAIGIFITMSLISVKVFTIWLNARYDFSVYKGDEASSTYSEIYLPSSSIGNSLKDHNPKSNDNYHIYERID